MGAGLTVTLIGYRLVFGRGRPLWSPRFNLPTSTAIDSPLISGTVRSGNYRVNFRDGNEATAYYTDNLEDAVNSAVEIARKRASGVTKVCPN
jgi:hypothetical protein